MVDNRIEERTGVYLKSLTKNFGSVVAVDDISLHVPEGEFLTLLGPSGSGKTTTLMMIAGFEMPTAGQIFIRGEDILSVPAYDRNIGMVFQSYALFPHMTVFGNIAFPLTMRKIPKKEIKERVECYGLENFRHFLMSHHKGRISSKHSSAPQVIRLNRCNLLIFNQETMELIIGIYLAEKISQNIN